MRLPPGHINTNWFTPTNSFPSRRIRAMRTRFLTTNYFTPSASSSSRSPETLAFLRFPAPHLPSPALCNFEHILCSSFDSVLPFCLTIDRLPIDDALSILFSDVLPRNIDGGPEGFTDDETRSFTTGDAEICSLEKKAGASDEEREIEDHKPLGPKILEEGTNIIVDCRDEDKFQIFEAPELDMLMEKALLFENEEMEIPLEVPDIENNLDMLKQGLKMQYPHVVLESVYSVEDITVDYPMDQKTQMLEDASSIQDKIDCCHSTFPLLEVDEISFGISTSQFVDEQLLLNFENIELHCSTQKEDLMVDGEFLGSMKIDMLEYFSGHSSSKHCIESELASQNLFLEMDAFMKILEISHFDGNSEYLPGVSDSFPFSLLSPIHFQEFQILDMDSSLFSEVFAMLQTADEPGACEQMSMEHMNVKNFHELIISHELALVESTFKALPVPGFTDYEKLKSLHAFAEEILFELKSKPLPASDGIYLDWHLLEEDKCNSVIYSTYRKMFDGIDSYTIDSDLKNIDCGMLVFDFVFLGDIPNMENTEESKESLNILSGGNSMLDGHLTQDTSNKLLDAEQIKARDEELSSDINAEKVSSLFKSMSQFSDLEFFLNPQKATGKANIETATKDIVKKAAIPVVSSTDQIAACASTEIQFQKWDIKLCQVKLSDNIVAIFNSFQKNYLTILGNNAELKEMLISYQDADCYQLLRLPKERLMYCIKKLCSQQSSLAHIDESIMTLVTLYAIKQMAWYLCFYGIHSTHLYLEKLYQSLQYLKYRLELIQSLIEDAHEKADKEITRSHPSLSIIRGILQSNAAAGNLKVLIVADQVFWFSLKKLLTSMRISSDELQNFPNQKNHPDASQINEFEDAKIDDLLHSDCLIASQGHISGSFPFNKFGIILEYGGFHGSSRISTISTKLAGLPCLYHLKMDLEDFTIPKALSGGFDLPQNVGISMEGMIQSIEILNQHINDEKSKNKLDLVAVNEADACSLPLPVMEPLQSQPSMQSFPGTVIVVNTQNFDKEMLISRRSTYQRILALEKEGAQVVERDSSLPVDVIISADICLVWYDCRNIGKKATSLDEASSCLPLCVEDIATNVLTLLSFTFSSCILVFEGEISFLASIMESSDGLYAAAASLGIHLQLFCSYSSELTDEIILSCVGYATELTRCPYRKMPESETLAESFFTKFPSINPLAAHAILSSGGILVEFLEWSHERRIQAIQKYRVPDESVTLLSALCRYGEEDSKSGITECSSSVSSAPDSKNFHYKIEPERKKQKRIGSPFKNDEFRDDLLNFESLNQFTNFSDFNLDTSPVSKKYRDCWMSDGPEMLNDIKHSSSSLKNNLSGPKQKQVLEMDTVENPSMLFKLSDSQVFKGSERPHKMKNPGFFLNDELLGERQGSDAAARDWHSNNNPEDLHKDNTKHSSSSLKNKWLGSKQKRVLETNTDGNPSTLFKLSDAQVFKDSEMLHESKKPGFPFNDKLLSERQGSDAAARDWHGNNNPEDLHKDTEGAIVDFHNSFLIGEDFSSITKSFTFSPLVVEVEEDPAGGKSKTSRRLSFGNSSHPTFPTAAEINCNSDIWTTLRDQKQSLGKGIVEFQDTELGRGKLPVKHQKKLVEGSMHGSAKGFCGPSFQDKDTHYGGTLLSNALNSVNLQQGSPWTIEFLNRVREKSKLRQHSLSCDRFGPYFDYSDNISKVTKRKSPSIFEFYKYQGGGTSKKVSEQKRQKRPFQTLRSYKRGNASASSYPTWTPIDKRAKQTLSFAANGSGSQTKLVWGDGNAQCLNKRF